MGVWNIVNHPEGANVMDSTWAFKIKKLKAWFCICGDQQVHGIGFCETYAPVVQWTTARLMVIFEVQLGLKSKQGDITAAFVHADLEEGENIYVELPRGFRKQG